MHFLHFCYLLDANSDMCYIQGVKLKYIFLFLLHMVHFQNVWKLHFPLEGA